MNKRLLQMAVMCMLMVITATVVVFVMLEFSNANEDESSLITIESDIKDIPSGFNDAESSGEIGYITISGTDTLFIENGMIKASPLLCNYNENYFIRIIIKFENGDELYRSGLIPSMKGVSDVEVHNKLESGEYLATIIYEYFNVAGTAMSSKLNVQVKLSVK